LSRWNSCPTPLSIWTPPLLRCQDETPPLPVVQMNSSSTSLSRWNSCPTPLSSWTPPLHRCQDKTPLLLLCQAELLL
jgi:hypothetical protein